MQILRYHHWNFGRNDISVAFYSLVCACTAAWRPQLYDLHVLVPVVKESSVKFPGVRASNFNIYLLKLSSDDRVGHSVIECTARFTCSWLPAKVTNVIVASQFRRMSYGISCNIFTYIFVYIYIYIYIYTYTYIRFCCTLFRCGHIHICGSICFIYRKISNIRSTKSQNLYDSRLV